MSPAGTWLTGLALCIALPAHSADGVIDVAHSRAGVFHHLDASGRNSLAVSDDGAALVWEDNRSGDPVCYLAVKSAADKVFKEFSFGQGECYEPGIAAMDGGRYLLIWEDATGVNVALADATGPAPATRLAASGGQGNVVFDPKLGAYAAWSSPEGRWRRIWSAPLKLEGRNLRVGEVHPADAAPPADDQTFPVLAASPQGLMLVWEDRRHGHTVILGSQTSDLRNWSQPVRVSGNPTGKQQGNLGRGTGAMRPALTTFGTRIAATWLDKRDFLSGYDVYAALTGVGEAGLRFSKDRKAQDSFGDAIAQWHVAAAGNAQGDLLIAWDDDRDGTADIWLTRLSGSDYGENFTVPEAVGPGQQSDPVIALDASGTLHLAWIERGDDAMTRLRYTTFPQTGVRPQAANIGSE